MIYEELFECDRRMKKAERQTEHLCTRRSEIFQRYLAAYKSHDRNFRVVCRGRLLIVEGVLSVYRMYIERKKREILSLRKLLYCGIDIAETVADDNDLVDDIEMELDEV